MTADAQERVIGRHGGLRPGPTVVVTGAVHGNEPAGVAAIRRVLERLRGEGLPLRGELIGVAGNLRALAEDRRYLTRDLNRRWSPRDIGRLVNAGADEASEDHETLELLELLLPVIAGARAPVVFLDLHSTSGPARPFSCMADVLRNRAIALALPIPAVLGLEEVIDGSMLGYFCDLGHIGVGVEGGQHRDPATVDCLESALWLALVAAGSLDARELPELATHRERLADRTVGLPPVLEIRHRHVVRPFDEPFVMEPGFENFLAVARGQVVAHDRHGPVRAPLGGVMMLPRYQGQGDDGYFVAGVVSPAALSVSAALRRLRLDRLVPYLPGVRRDPERPDHFVAPPEVAGSRVRDVFHLFGYRHVRAHGEQMVFTRRSPSAHGARGLPAELRPIALRCRV